MTNKIRFILQYRRDEIINNLHPEPVAIAFCFLAGAVVSGAVVLDMVKFPINKINGLVKKIKNSSHESNF